MVSVHSIEDSGKTHEPSTSLYIKKMGKNAVYRVEDRKHPHTAAVDFIYDVFNPYEKVDKSRPHPRMANLEGFGITHKP